MPDGDIVVSFKLGRVLDLKLTDFNQQNVVSDLVVRHESAKGYVNPFSKPGHDLAYEIELGGCYGLYGTIVTLDITIETRIGKPADAREG